MGKEFLKKVDFSAAYLELGFKNEPSWLFEEVVRNWDWFQKQDDEAEAIQYLIENELNIKHAETGADREFDFDPQAYFEKHYLA